MIFLKWNDIFGKTSSKKPDLDKIAQLEEELGIGNEVFQGNSRTARDIVCEIEANINIIKDIQEKEYDEYYSHILDVINIIRKDIKLLNKNGLYINSLFGEKIMLSKKFNYKQSNLLSDLESAERIVNCYKRILEDKSETENVLDIPITSYSEDIIENRTFNTIVARYAEI